MKPRTSILSPRASNMNNPTLELAIELIGRPSVTPADGGCQDIMIARLEKLGFTIERLRFEDVDNFWARRGEAGPLLVFAGHTDVVPPGRARLWDSDPFVPEIRNGRLYGRGAADMKSSLAAFITAIEGFIEAHPQHQGAIGLLITSDEEGPSVNGTVKVIEWLQKKNIHIDYCVVGEPTAEDRLGDVIKNGRRGSLNAVLTVKGIQGHVAYPQFARNPIHGLAPVVGELLMIKWDQGNEFFPPTTFQTSNFHSGIGANNVIPDMAEVEFNFRFSTEVTEDTIRKRVESVLEQHCLDYELHWSLSGLPFLTPAGELVEAAKAAIEAETGQAPTLSTSGGTSDGRFIAPTGSQVIEIGPRNATIHKANECIEVADLALLSAIYRSLMAQLLT